MMGCWAQMTSARLARNAEIGAKKGKAVKKKASAPSSVGGGEAESSAPKKSKAKAKEPDDVVLTLTRHSGAETSCQRRQGHMQGCHTGHPEAFWQANRAGRQAALSITPYMNRAGYYRQRNYCSKFTLL
jgi:hypothetical protein